MNKIKPIEIEVRSLDTKDSEQRLWNVYNRIFTLAWFGKDPGESNDEPVIKEDK